MGPVFFFFVLSDMFTEKKKAVCRGTVRTASPGSEGPLAGRPVDAGVEGPTQQPNSPVAPTWSYRFVHRKFSPDGDGWPEPDRRILSALFRRPLCSVSINRPAGLAQQQRGESWHVSRWYAPTCPSSTTRADSFALRGIQAAPEQKARDDARSPAVFYGRWEHTTLFFFFPFEKTAEASCSINPRGPHPSRRPSVRFLSFFLSLLSCLLSRLCVTRRSKFSSPKGSRGRGDRRAASNR